MKDSTFEKYKRVIEEWLHNGRNGTKAYQHVYPKSSKENAEVNFIKILRNARVKQFVEKREKEISEKAEKDYGVSLESQIEDLLSYKDAYRELQRLAIKENPTELERDKLKRLKSIMNLPAIAKVDDQLNKLLALYEEHNNQKSTGKKQVYIFNGREIEI